MKLKLAHSMKCHKETKGRSYYFMPCYHIVPVIFLFILFYFPVCSNVGATNLYLEIQYEQEDVKYFNKNWEMSNY